MPLLGSALTQINTCAWQLLHAIARTFEKKFEGVKKASATMIREVQQNYTNTCTHTVARTLDQPFHADLAMIKSRCGQVRSRWPVCASTCVGC